MNLIKEKIKKHKIVLVSLGLLILISGGLFFNDVLAYISVNSSSSNKILIGTLDKGLVGHWPLTETYYSSSTNRVDDISGYGNHGTNYGAQVKNQGAKFDGTDDYIGITDNDAWSFEGNEPFSVSAFIRTSNPSQYRGGVLGNNEYLGGGYKLGFYNGNIYFSLHSNSNSYNIYTGFPANIWRHVVGTYDGDRMRFYINGDMKDDITGANLIDNGSDFLIGKAQQEGWEPFIGDVANVKVYNRTLSDYEIQTLFDKERGDFGI